MMLYYFEGKWKVASSGLPDASGKVFIESEDPVQPITDQEIQPTREHHKTKSDGTFADLFWRIFNEKGYKIPDETDKNMCFMFELATPKNKVIVNYTEDYLYLHGCRNLTNLYEDDPTPFALKYNWLCSPSFEFKSIEEVLEASKKLNPAYAEGFVIRDHKFQRVKVNLQHILFFHLFFCPFSFLCSSLHCRLNLHFMYKYPCLVGTIKEV